MSTATSTWKRKASSSEGGDFELPPGGSHGAALVGLIDLGTSPQTYNGETKSVHKILFVWELTAEHTSKGESFKVAKDFNFSLNSKAKLRAFLEGWMGRKFGDDEEIDVSTFMGMLCVLNLTEGVSAGGKKFVDVVSANKLMKGQNIPPISVESFVWDFDGQDPRNEPEIPEWVPMLYGRKVVDDIKKSDEWGNLSPF